MLYHLLYQLKILWFGFNVFKYITFRTAMASLTAFFICIIFGPAIIQILTRLKAGQNIRKEYVENLYELHKHKAGTPSMGGIIIILAILVSTILWARLDNRFVILCIITILWLGTVGFIDDYIKIVKRRSMGLKASTKFLSQFVFASFVAIFLYKDPNIGPSLYIPFIKYTVVNMGVWYILFSMLVIVGSSNAVNLTDGLDGLAIGCATIFALAFGIICYVAGNINMSGYLNIFYVPGSGELAVICGALVGAGLGFLWYNSYPANVFMGDTGSLSLGGLLGVISLVVKKEILFAIIGGVFVVEVLSVMLQVFSVKARRKKLFLMSPIHHHFQLKGLHESKVIIRFWIAAIILALFALTTLKLQ